MDPIFEPYFAARVQQIGRQGLTAAPPEEFIREPLSGPAREPAFNARVFSAVARGYEDVGPGRVRPDAELLLQLAFSELLAQPLLAVRGRQVNVNELLANITSDARTITRNALAEVPGPVSAHGIVNATSRSWDELRTASFEVWD